MVRNDRRGRRLRGKTDTIDAENAAKAVLAGLATAVPKSADGRGDDPPDQGREGHRRHDELRQELQPLSKMALIHRCAALRPGKVTTVLAATKHTLRAIARRWEYLNDEITAHEKLLTELTTTAAPDLAKAFAVGPDTAAEMLIVAGDNPDRVRSEAAFARLCGVAPVPTSSGLVTRHRLKGGGHCQANAALYRVVIVRMQHHEPTKAYVARRTAEGKTKAEITRCLKRLLARELWPPCARYAATHRNSPTPLDGYRSINAAMESFNWLLQKNVLDRRRWRTREELHNAVVHWVEHTYNNRRRQRALGKLTPVEYELAFTCQAALAA